LQQNAVHLISEQLSSQFCWGQFHQHYTYSFYARGAQKRKKDSQVVSLFTLLGSTSVKAERKYVDEIDTWSLKKGDKL